MGNSFGRLAALVVLVSFGSAIFAACGGESDSGCSAAESITVLAASSLRNVLEETFDDFARVQPCVDVSFSFGSSGALATQVLSGVPADVFMSAGKKATEQVVGADLVVGPPADFARNSLAIMVSGASKFADDIASINDLSDSQNSGIKVGLCSMNAPCGALADKVLGNAVAAYANLLLTRDELADTEADSVEGVVTKVKLGELDAGLVYASDCQAARKSSDVKCIDIPADVNGVPLNDSTTYSVMSLNDQAATIAYTEFILGDAFLSILVDDFGFAKI